jgi:hypothetical protein
MKYPIYRADGERNGVQWTAPASMPRDLSRITLEIEDVRVARLRKLITPAECVQPWIIGVRKGRIEGGGSVYEGNPWMWVVKLRRINP